MFTELANTMMYGGGVLYNFVFTELPFKTLTPDVTVFHRIQKKSFIVRVYLKTMPPRLSDLRGKACQPWLNSGRDGIDPVSRRGILLCKVKRQYLITWQVSRYCLSAQHSGTDRTSSHRLM